jgi:hypothetical protein
MKYLPNFDLIVIDECFPAGSLVDGNPIESLKIGDMVNSFNEDTGEIESKPIVRLFLKLSTSKVVVTIGNKKIECTEEHPFYTQRGWMPANQLTTEDYLYVQNQLFKLPERIQNANGTNKSFQRKGHCTVLLKPVQEGVQGISPQSSIDSLIPRISPNNQAVCGMFDRFPSNIGIQAQNKKTILFCDVRGCIQKPSIRKVYGGNKWQVCLSQNDCQQSNEQYGNSIQDDGNTQENWTQTIGTGREWQGCDSSAANAIRCTDSIFQWLGYGIDCQYKPRERQWISLSLQNRYCESSRKNSSGDRREFALCDGAERTGCEKNGILKWIGVDSVEIHQQAGNGGLKERFVYNIEVLDNHN